MAEGEPLDSKQTLQSKSSDDVFKVFHERYDEEAMSVLCKAYKNLSREKAFALKACTIKTANCLEPVSFTKALVSVEEHLDNWYPIGMIFLTGLRIIQTFLQDGKAPDNPKQRAILSSLLTYLLDKDITTALTNASEYKNESKITLLVLNHLLLRLTPKTKCSLDLCTSWNFRCPDSCKYELSELLLKTSDTSIGHHDVWHGRIEALIGRPSAASTVIDLALTIINPADEEASDNQGFRSCIEVKQDFVSADKPHNQILSQTIVFSFLQKRMNPSGISLIPTIGISGTEIVVYFYDHEKDVLLQSRGIPFKEKGESQITAVLVAWLVVNYKYLGDGLVESLNQAPKANFFSLCKDKEDIYKNRIRHGVVGKGESYHIDLMKYERSTLESPHCLEELAEVIPKKKKKSE